MLEHNVFRVATELTYIKRSSASEVAYTESKRTFELSLQNGIDVPVYVKTGFRQRDQIYQQKRKIDKIFRAAELNAHFLKVSENFPDAGKTCNYVLDKYSKASAEIVCIFFKEFS